MCREAWKDEEWKSSVQKVSPVNPSIPPDSCDCQSVIQPVCCHSGRGVGGGYICDTLAQPENIAEY